MSFSAPAYVSLFLPLAVMLSALLRRSRVYKPWHSLLGLAFLGLSGWQQPLVFLALVAGNVLVGRLPGRARRVAAVIWNVGAVVLSRLSLPVAWPQGISYAAFQALSWHLDDEQGGAGACGVPAAAVHGLFGLYRHGVGRGACGGVCAAR